MKSDYHERQDRRRERYENAAERAKANSDAARQRSDDLVGGIPLGQPILVGHHSERRHRNALKKSDKAMRRCLDEENRAREFAGKAASVGSAGISSDDPDAVAKLKEKLAGMEQEQELMKGANKAIRAAYKKGIREDGPDEDIDILCSALEKSTGRKFPRSAARQMMKPDFCGRRGFPDYALQNNNANMRRVKERIKQLETAEDAENREYERAGVKVVENADENRLQLFFDGKPDYETRSTLKHCGFRWARSLGCWQRHLNNGARYAAERVLSYLEESTEK